MVYQHVLYALITLVKAGEYVLSEDDRSSENQKVVPEDYKLAVAQKIAESII